MLRSAACRRLRLRPAVLLGSRLSSTTIPSIATSSSTTIVATRETARRVAQLISALPPETYGAWDTEVIDVDLETQSPVGHGRVICASFFCGPQYDFGSGPRVWIDALDGEEGTLAEFKAVLENPSHRKVFHNYSFDRHVLFNHGIDVRGLGADTMHMARVWNTDLKRSGGYSLESVSKLLLDTQKVPMSRLFASPKLKKDGTPGKVLVLPPLDEVQRDPALRQRWIHYSTFDAEATWRVREELERRLRDRPWIPGRSLWDLYTLYIRPFAECLTDMERAGIRVDTQTLLPEAERKALIDRNAAEATFRDWAAQFCPDARLMNISSDAQNARLLFAPCTRVRSMWSRKKTAVSAVVNAPGVDRGAAAPPLLASVSGAKRPAKRAVGADAPLPTRVTLTAAASRSPPSSGDVQDTEAAVTVDVAAPSADNDGGSSGKRSKRLKDAAAATIAAADVAAPSSVAVAAAAGVDDASTPKRKRAVRSPKATAPDLSDDSVHLPTALPEEEGIVRASPAPGPASASLGGGARRSFTSWAGDAVRLVRSASWQRERPWRLRWRADSKRTAATSSTGSQTVDLIGPRTTSATRRPRRQTPSLADAATPATSSRAPPAVFVGDDSSGTDDAGSGSSTDAGGLLRASLPQDTDAEQLFFLSASEDAEEEVALEYAPSVDVLRAPPRGSKGRGMGPPMYSTYKEHAPVIAAEVEALAAAAAASEQGGGNGPSASPHTSKTPARDAERWPACHTFKIPNTEGFIEPGKSSPAKTRDVVITGLGIPPVARTESGWPAANSAVLKALAGSQRAGEPVGKAHAYFGGGEEGARACAAIHALYTVSTIDTMLSNFIVPLQLMTDAQSRIHCSMNLNTETGRLSARRPNLQNQPALEKDRYGVRKAFQAAPGCKLIVADYGQLELRVLAHMSNCKSMIDAFKAGGDFHSRTAMGMYPHVAEACARGDVLLEWDDSKGAATAPLLKNVFGAERRKAKVLNFSIAYGKTALGLSKDWGVSLQEATDTLERWYSDRPEVRDWQAHVLRSSRAESATRTLLGRYRDLPDINSPDVWLRRHAERAAINTPIQGGAADIVMLAMLKIWRNRQLAALGWKMLLQVHDELLLEGPEETADAAFALVVDDMAHPFDMPLKIDLVVDAKIAGNWYEAK